MNNKKLISILYEDKTIVVLNKPSGCLSVPAEGHKTRDLWSMLNQEMAKRVNPVKVFPCHRLDKDTSGVIIFAKGKNNQQLVMNEFRRKTIYKTYIAFVQGSIKKKRGVIKGYLKGAWPYRKDAKSKLAITKYELLQRTKDFSVLKLVPLTGRTNQIRIQFRKFGHPLVGERRFAFAREWKVKFNRVALHSLAVELMHPSLRKRLRYQAPLPADMKKFLHKHGVYFSSC
jgi:23S rRNA pseudouridine1911/1915/1917 synthase